MKETHFHELCSALMNIPTGPYHEHFVVVAIREYAARRPHIHCSEDRFGNLTLTYHKGSNSGLEPSIVATAHLDHPGLGWVSTLGKRDFAFERLGSLPLERIDGAPLRIYNVRNGEWETFVRATVVARMRGKKLHFRVRAAPGENLQLLGPGAFAVWDLPPVQRRGDRIYASACDDLAGAIVGLCWLDELNARGAACSAALLLTRAEEIGFGGMLAAVRGNCLKRNRFYLNIECSSTRAGAQLGGGPVIRVGDRRRIFDPAVASALTHLAELNCDLKPGARYQRRLMDSGTCEATVLQRAGYATGAVALPLGNYHNLGRTELQREIVDQRDALMLVDLLTAIAVHPEGLEGARQASDATLAGLLDGYHAESEPRLLRTTP